jgi:hypothetical protein
MGVSASRAYRRSGVVRNRWDPPSPASAGLWRDRLYGTYAYSQDSTHNSHWSQPATAHNIRQVVDAPIRPQLS